jgi:hypothetical protein
MQLHEYLQQLCLSKLHRCRNKASKSFMIEILFRREILFLRLAKKFTTSRLLNTVITFKLFRGNKNKFSIGFNTLLSLIILCLTDVK